MKFYATTPLQPDIKPSSIVFLLHGWGADGRDLLSIADAWKQDFPDTLFVCLEAPQVCEANPFGFQWFSLGDMSEDTLKEGVISARQGVHDVIHSILQQQQVEPGNVVIMGFSQGMMMALSVGLRQEKPFAGILGYSGALADAEDNLPETYPKPDICLIHGEADSVIPVSMHQHSVDWLKTHQYSVESLRIPGLPHGIDMQALEKGREFLKKCL